MQAMTLLGLMMMTTSVGCVDAAPPDPRAGWETGAGASSDAGPEASSDAGWSEDAGRREDSGGGDAGGLRPGDAGPARLSLSVEQAWFHERGALRLAVEVGHEGGAAATLEASDFVVVGAPDLEARGANEGLFSCDGDLPEGERRRCTLGFATDESSALEGLFLQHRDAAPAPIHACGPAHPLGLCRARYACVEGACERMCSRFHWDGPCANEDEVCDRGYCVAPCSDQPGSGCEEGTCVEGACVPECGAIALPDNACFDCAWDLFDSGQCEVEDACNDCASCPSAQGPGRPPPGRCECAQSEACDGCEPQVTRYWDCILEACPTCRE